MLTLVQKRMKSGGKFDENYSSSSIACVQSRGQDTDCYFISLMVLTIVNRASHSIYTNQRAPFLLTYGRFCKITRIRCRTSHHSRRGKKIVALLKCTAEPPRTTKKTQKMLHRC
jgi:hypothetical protein